MNMNNFDTRRGIAIPLIAVCIIGLFAFIALAIDLGMLAVSRTHAQNAADIAALIGTRTLSNRPGMVNNNLANAVAAARTAATSNLHLNSQFTNAQVQRIDVGQYLYDANGQQFRVSTWYDVTGNSNISPPSGSWTAMRVRINAAQTTYFMRLLGVNTMSTYAVATAVYRPRDIAFVLDMTGSMQFSCMFNMNGRSHNPDTLIPRFGHYSNNTIQSQLIASNNISSGAYAYARNNFTIYTPAGPPIIRNFYFDPSNLNNPSTPVVNVNPNNLRNAFHRWNPPESGANPDA
ncbi:MAG: Tad domain-containing protein, partial [Thermogemmata sp.]|nr:Tad domain-containing protein [Thermogemmata sp.]